MTSQAVDRVNPPTVPAPEGGYAHGVILPSPARLLFVSGQIPLSDLGVPNGFEAQCRQVWTHVMAVVAAAGGSAAHLVKVTTYLADRAHAETNGRIRREFLGTAEPALTVVIAGIFDPAWLLEVEAIAAMPV